MLIRRYLQMDTRCQLERRSRWLRMRYIEILYIFQTLTNLILIASCRRTCEEGILIATSRLVLDQETALVIFSHILNKYLLFPTKILMMTFYWAGQKYAMMSQKVVLSSIFRNFHVESVEKLEDMVLLGELVLRPRDGIKVRLIRRTKERSQNENVWIKSILP